jgi:hypothetical protein
MEFNIPIEVYEDFNEVGNEVPLFCSLFRVYDIKLNKVNLKDLIKDNKKFITLYTISWNELSPPQTAKDLEINLKTILDKIDNSIITACNEKRCAIIIHSFQIYLGIENDEVGYQPFFNRLYSELKKRGLENFDSFYYITSFQEDQLDNTSVLGIYDENNKINVISHMFIEEFFRCSIAFENKSEIIQTGGQEIEKEINDGIVTEDEALTHKRKKYFLCYNKFPRTHRIKLGEYLYNNKLIDKGLFSFCMIRPGAYDGMIPDEMSKSKLKFVESTPYNLDHDYNLKGIYDAYEHPDKYIREKIAPMEEKLGYHLEKLHYLDTYFQIVAESEQDEAYTFTEKTFKPILQLQPFIMVGGPKVLKFLRKFGYETFPEIFDESYDTILDHGERLDFICDEINRVCKLTLNEWDDMYRSVWDKLVHNRKLFLKRNTQFLDLFKEVNEKI